MDPYIGCTVKQLAPEHHVAAMRTAVERNPANAVIDPRGLLSVQRLAVMTQKYWGPKGVKLGVSFLDTDVREFIDMVIAHMNAWYDRGANVRFAWSQSNGEVRITRGPTGYWSYLGTDILHVGAGQPTMNLQAFTRRTPLSEWKRVVRHETGHTLGFPHEHMRRAIVDRIDPTKAVLYFGRTQGWDANEVRQQVLTPLDEGSLRATEADTVSVMCYALPGEIMADGQPVPGGPDIDPLDAKLAAEVYPLAVVSPPPPPAPPVSPPPPAASGVIRIDPTARLILAPAGWEVQKQ